MDTTAMVAALDQEIAKLTAAREALRALGTAGTRGGGAFAADPRRAGRRR